MADLKKLFVLVPAGTIGTGEGKTTLAAIKTASAAEGNSKIYFVEDTNEIVVKGVAYGANPTDLARITALEGTVGDSTKGLVKGVADNASAISALQTLLGASSLAEDGTSVTERIAALETLVSGAADSDEVIENLTEVLKWFNGVKEADGEGAALLETVAKLDGDATTAGSVAEAKKTAGDAQSTANAAQSAADDAKTAAEAADGKAEAAQTAADAAQAAADAADSKAVTAQSSADAAQSTANAAKTAAEAAQSSADDALDKIGDDDTANTVKGRIKALEGTSHTHNNKTVLDGITSTQVSTWDTAAAKQLSVKEGSANYVEVADHAVGVKTTALGNVNLVYNESAKTWSAPTAAPDSLTGLATAADVAAEIVANEKVVAAALNDHESRIAALEQVNSTRDLTSTVTATDSDTSEFVSATVTIAQDADGKLTSEGSSVDVDLTTATYTAASNTITDGLVTASTLKAVLEDMWETYSATTV